MNFILYIPILLWLKSDLSLKFDWSTVSEHSEYAASQLPPQTVSCRHI